MAKFKIEEKRLGDHLLVKLFGGLDEDAVFSSLNVSKLAGMDVDFQDVDAVNSCGVREWVKWLETIPPQIQIRYLNCPKIIIDQINMVGGLFRKGIKVNSFYVPYYCEACKLQTKILFTSGKEFEGPKVTPPESVKCSKCQGPTEIDVMETKYFKFLSRQG